ncbi:unnamed protein product [Amoebophrya sp. A120]|nr:unnamed protein product [Amoebophrya sp. A120]|eukprot:GSA120T00012315001.1
MFPRSRRSLGVVVPALWYAGFCCTQVFTARGEEASGARKLVKGLSQRFGGGRAGRYHPADNEVNTLARGETGNDIDAKPVTNQALTRVLDRVYTEFPVKVRQWFGTWNQNAVEAEKTGVQPAGFQVALTNVVNLASVIPASVLQETRKATSTDRELQAALSQLKATDAVEYLNNVNLKDKFSLEFPSNTGDAFHNTFQWSLSSDLLNDPKKRIDGTNSVRVEFSSKTVFADLFSFSRLGVGRHKPINNFAALAVTEGSIVLKLVTDQKEASSFVNLSPHPAVDAGHVLSFPQATASGATVADIGSSSTIELVPGKQENKPAPVKSRDEATGGPTSVTTKRSAQLLRGGRPSSQTPSPPLPCRPSSLGCWSSRRSGWRT